MARFVERITFLVFREQDGRWQIVSEYNVQTMAEDHLTELKRTGVQCGVLRVRTKKPREEYVNG
jgi:hypothetical protein